MTFEITSLIQTAIVFLITGVLAVLSPFGLAFIVFSFIRGKTKNESLKKVSFIFQVILTALTFVVGVLTSLLFSVRGLPFYSHSQGWMYAVAIICGIMFVNIIEIGIILWQGFEE
jgi:hypothetical protein